MQSVYWVAAAYPTRTAVDTIKAALYGKLQAHSAVVSAGPFAQISIVVAARCQLPVVPQLGQSASLDCFALRVWFRQH